MNFSNNQGLKKVLSLSLAGAMTLGLFTGCMKKGADETIPSDTQSNLNLSLGETNPPETQTTPTETQAVTITENSARVINQLTVRNLPTKEATVVGTLDAGDIVEIQQTGTTSGISWGRITEPVAGWICMDYVEMLDPNSGSNLNSNTGVSATTPTVDNEPDNTTTQSYKGVVTGKGLNIRNDPSTSGTLVGQYAKGDVITILETKNGWGRTDKGWVNLDYVNSSSDSNTSSNTNSGSNTSTGSNTSSNTSGNGSTSVIAKGIVTANELNVRSTASTDGTRVKSLTKGTRVEILEKSGDWGRIKDGWISLNYVYQDGAKGTNTAKGIITGSKLNIRSGPGTGYDSVGSYTAGDRVNILEQFTYDGVTWGCTSKGWISMSYVYVDGTDVGESGNGTVSANGLNIRSGPGTSYESVGSYNEGDEITILYRLEVGSTTWGCTSKGWVSMDYVTLD